VSFADQREIFVQAPGEHRGGLVVASINSGEKQAKQRVSA
jgi:hypothetical protein